MSDSNQTTLSHAVVVDTEQVESGINRAVAQFERLGDAAQREGQHIQSSMADIGKAAAAYFSIQALKNFASSIVQVRGEIESLEISFETLLGSKEKADALFGSIREFAVNTPMTMGALASGAQTLLGFGIAADKVMPIMQAIGDVSMGDAQKFNSLTLAFAQASSAGKLAGQDFLQMVNAGFNPLNEMARTTGRSFKELKKDMEDGKITTAMLEGAFMSAASEGGQFYGMLEKQSQGIKGALSNLQGAWDDMLNDIGSKQQSVFVDGVNMLTDLLKNYEPFLNAILSVAAAYGAYKAALMAVWVIEKARALAENIQLIMMFRKELGLLTAAQQAFNITAWANPYVLLAAAVAGLIAALYLYSDSASDAEVAQKALNDERDEFQKSLDEERNKIEECIRTVQSKTATDFDQLKAYEELQRMCPQLTEAYTREELAVADLADTTKMLNEITNQRSYDNAVEQLEKWEQALQSAKDADGNWGKLDEQSDALIRTVHSWGLLKNAIPKIQEVVNGYREQVDEMNRLREQAAEEALPLEQRIETQTTIVSDLQQRVEEARQELNDAQVHYEAEPTLWNKLIQIQCQWSFDFNRDQLNAAESKLQTLQAQTPKTYQEAVAAARQELADAQAEMRRARQSGTAQDYTNAKEKRDQAVKTLQGYGIETKNDKTVANEAKQRAKKRKELLRELEQIRVDGALKIESLELQVLEDGLKKKLQQIEIDRKSQIAAIERERKALEVKLAEINMTIPADVAQQFTDRITAVNNAAAAEVRRTNEDNAKYIAGLYRTLSDVFSTEEQRKLAEIKNRYKEQREQLEKDKAGGTVSDDDYNNLMGQMNRAEAKETEDYWLETYGDYYQKRKSLSEEWEVTLANIPPQYAAQARRQMQQELSELDLTEFKKNLNWEEVFGNLDRVSTASLRSLKTKLQDFIKTQKDLSPEAARALAEAIEKIDDKLTERNPFESLGTSFKSLKTSTDAVKVAQKAYNKALKEGTDAEKEQARATLEAAQNAKQKALVDATKSIQAACGRMQEYIGVATALTDCLSSFGVEIPPELSGFIEGIGAAVDGLESIDLTKPMSIFTGLFKTVGGIGKAIGSLFNHDDRKEKKIQKLQVEVDNLQRSYDKLGDALDGVYSTDASDLIEQQNKMLEQQKVLIQNQIAEEKSKKHTDNDRIREWEQQIEDINAVIADNKEAAIDAIFGDDLKSAIENFADAYADAWANGEDRAKSARDTVRDMMKKMVTESIKAAIQSSGAMERIRQKLAEFYNDGILTEWEQNYVYGMAETLQKELDEQFGWAESLLTDDDAERSGAQKGIATASQDSVDENNARLATIQGHTYTLVQGVNELNATANAMLERLTGIERNTGETAEKLDTVRDDMRKVKNAVEDIQTQGLRLKR
ncbi:MAG: tape measure protein [Ruminococcus sp.]|nr:tape measure protein [Ruminococcus sp.]